MSIKYYKLFDLLNRRGMKKSDLREILSSPTVAKLSKGKYIHTTEIEKICRFLHCQPGDIMECVLEDDQVIDDELYNSLVCDIEASTSGYMEDTGEAFILFDTVVEIIDSYRNHNVKE